MPDYERPVPDDGGRGDDGLLRVLPADGDVKNIKMYKNGCGSF